jgi:hypothetical protein
MKRLLIAVIILTTGSGVFCSMQSDTRQVAGNLSATRESIRARSTELEAARQEREQLQARDKELRRALRSAEASGVQAGGAWELASLLSGAGREVLTAEVTEKLLAELGFNWNTTGEFLIVSKPTLSNVSMNGMKGARLTDAVCGVLAVTPSERSAIEATTQKVVDDYRAWAENHLERTEPHGDVVAEYKVTIGPEFSQNANNTFTGQVISTLGAERGELFLRYASEWMHSLGLEGSEPTTLTVNRQANRDDNYYLYTIKGAYSTMTTAVNPWQPFPEAFRPMFPKGWADLAAREGFELPKEFNKPRIKQP